MKKVLVIGLVLMVGGCAAKQIPVHPFDNEYEEIEDFSGGSLSPSEKYTILTCDRYREYLDEHHPGWKNRKFSYDEIKKYMDWRHLKPATLNDLRVWGKQNPELPKLDHWVFALGTEFDEKVPVVDRRFSGRHLSPYPMSRGFAGDCEFLVIGP